MHGHKRHRALRQPSNRVLQQGAEPFDSKIRRVHDNILGAQDGEDEATTRDVLRLDNALRF